jgi:cation diffusion facilitator family transporter
MASGSNLVVYAALTANVGIAITKFVAAGYSGSSAMLTEAFHSLADSGNSILLLVGQHRSARPPDELHPFGHGQELYFYSVMVAVLIFGVGGGASLYEGVRHVMSPTPIENATASYIVLAVAAALEGTSWIFAVREFLRSKGPYTIWRAIERSKNPKTLTVFFEDGAALAGLAIAAAGIFASQHFHWPALDGVASILIGLLLCSVSIVLLREGKNLLIGEAAVPEVRDAIRARAEAAPAVRTVGRLITIQLGPESILLNLEHEFRDGLGASDIVRAVERLETKIREVQPHVRELFIEARSLEASNKG